MNKSILSILFLVSLGAPVMSSAQIPDLIPYRFGEKWGFSDKHKNIKIKPTYDLVNPFVDDRALVSLDGQWGFIDKKGADVIPLQFSAALNFSEEMAAVKNDSAWGFIDIVGKEIVPLTFDSLSHISQGRVLFWNKESETGFSPYSRKYPKLDPYFYPNREFSDGMTAVYDSSSWGYMDNKGELKIQMKFQEAGQFNRGLAPVKLNGKWGFIDKKGRTIIAFEYDSAGKFANGIAPVKFNKLWGYINKKGKVVIPPRFTRAESFENGLALIRNEWIDYYIDEKGMEYFDWDPAVNYFELGLDLFNMSEFDACIDYFGRAIQKNILDAEAYAYLGTALYKVNGDADRAIEYLDKTIRLRPDWMNSRYTRAEILMEEARFDEAIEGFSEIILRDASGLFAYLSRASCYIQLQFYDEAIEDLDYVLNVTPGATIALRNRGLAKLHKYLSQNHGMSEKQVEILKQSACDDMLEAIGMGAKDMIETFENYCEIK